MYICIYTYIYIYRLPVIGAHGCARASSDGHVSGICKLTCEADAS